MIKMVPRVARGTAGSRRRRSLRSVRVERAGGGHETSDAGDGIGRSGSGRDGNEPGRYGASGGWSNSRTDHRQQHDSAAVPLHDLGLRDRPVGVVGALDPHVGSESDPARRPACPRRRRAPRPRRPGRPAPEPGRLGPTSGRSAPLARRTEASELRQTTSTSPCARAALEQVRRDRGGADRSSLRSPPAGPRLARAGRERERVVSSVERSARGASERIDPSRTGTGIVDTDRAARRGRTRVAQPTPARTAVRVSGPASKATAADGDGELVAGAAGVEPHHRSPVRRPEPEGRPGPARSWFGEARPRSGSRRGAPTVTATALGPPGPRSPGLLPALLVGPAERRSLGAFGVTSPQPGTGGAPRGWGSQTTGTRRAVGRQLVPQLRLRGHAAAVVGDQDRPGLRRGLGRLPG